MTNYGSTTALLDPDSFKTIRIPAQRKGLSWSTLLSAISVVAFIGVLVTLTVTITIKPDATTTVEINTDVLKADAPSSEAAMETTTTRRSFRFRSRATRAPRAPRPPSVRLNQGRLTGTILKSRGGRDYSAFYTIPYGAPPVGELRFKPPQPAGNWTGTRNATVKGPMCVQQERYNPNVTIVGSEDCLYVHIFTPKIPRFFQRIRHPVIAYFFGGGFMHGTANDFGGDYFLDEDVVIVLVESRVGALGFLNTEDLEATGNQGLKDQVLALQWIQTNIAKFGGDPKKVKAFGTSSGAVGSHLHLFSPMTAGLVSGIMSFSGTALLSTTIDPNPRQKAMDLGKAIGCQNLTDSANLVKCLQNATVEQIGLHQLSFTFMPSVEAVPSDGNTNQTFLPARPYNLLQSGEFNKVPWLTGVNSAEAIGTSEGLLLDPNAVSNLNNNWDSYIPKLLNFQDTSTNDIAHEIRQFYFGDQPVSNETRYNLTNMLSDRMWIHPAKTSAILQAQQNTSVFMYYLTKEANVSYARDSNQYFEPPYGVSHADEVQYFFPRPRYPFIPLDSEWGNFSKMFVHAIVTFANSSAPVGPTEWPPVDPEGMGTVFFNLDDETKLVEPVNDRMELWDSFPMDVLYNDAVPKEDALAPNVLPTDSSNDGPSDETNGSNAVPMDNINDPNAIPVPVITVPVLDVPMEDTNGPIPPPMEPDAPMENVEIQIPRANADTRLNEEAEI